MGRRAEVSAKGPRLARRGAGRAERVASLTLARRFRAGADMVVGWLTNEGRVSQASPARLAGDEPDSPSQDHYFEPDHNQSHSFT